MTLSPGLAMKFFKLFVFMLIFSSPGNSVPFPSVTSGQEEEPDRDTFELARMGAIISTLLLGASIASTAYLASLPQTAWCCNGGKKNWCMYGENSGAVMCCYNRSNTTCRDADILERTPCLNNETLACVQEGKNYTQPTWGGTSASTGAFLIGFLGISFSTFLTCSSVAISLFHYTKQRASAKIRPISPVEPAEQHPSPAMASGSIGVEMQAVYQPQPSSVFVSDSCPICLKVFEPSRCDISFTSCGHQLHTSCLVSMLRANPSAFCPLCRAVLSRQLDER